MKNKTATTTAWSSAFDYATCGGNLTTAILETVLAKLPPPPKWKACVMRPSVCARLCKTSDSKAPLSAIESLAGLPIYKKEGQLASAWMFADEELLRKYLAGALSELDLMEMAASGACIPELDPSVETDG